MLRNVDQITWARGIAEMPARTLVEGDRCLVCGGRRDVRLARRRLTSVPPWVFPMGLIPWIGLPCLLILALLLYRRGELVAPLCLRCRSAWRRSQLTVLGIGLFGLLIALGGALWLSLGQDTEMETVTTWLAGSVLACLGGLLAVWLLVVRRYQIRALRVRGGTMWLRFPNAAVSRQVLDELEAIPDDVPPAKERPRLVRVSDENPSR